MRLCIGGGTDYVIPGWDCVDRKQGLEAYPLPYPDESADEIYASHILEHFPHELVKAVLADWVRVLRPAGRIRIAVPDFNWIARQYLAGHEFPIQGYVMGGHSDENDRHGAIFDESSLAKAMADVGLEHIATWRPEEVSPGWRGRDSASLPCSLNLEGVKPGPGTGKIDDVFAVLSAPRFAPVMHARCAFMAMGELGIPYCMGHGAFWHQVLSNIIEDSQRTLAAKGLRPKWVMTFDYDTIFEASQIRELYRLANQRDDIHAICALQMKRSAQAGLFSVAGEDGKVLDRMPLSVFDQDLVRIYTGHFGMTLIRLDVLNSLPKPWLRDTPAPDGSWAPEGKIDADVSMWLKFREHGLKLWLAPKVRVGHMQEVVTWPALVDDGAGDKTLAAVHRTLDEFEENGTPELA